MLLLPLSVRSVSLSLYTFLPVLVPKQLKQTFVVVYHAAADRFAVIPHSLSPSSGSGKGIVNATLPNPEKRVGKRN